MLSFALMRYRRLALLIAFYVTLDLTNPFIGSAFTFNVDESMEGASRQHERLLQQGPAVALPVRSGNDSGWLTRPALPPRPRVRALDEWCGQLRQAHAPLSDPQSPTDDH